MRNLILVLMAIALVSCASIEGLRDKSYTITKLDYEMTGAIAILPIKETAEMPGLAEAVETALAKSVSTNLPLMRVVDVQTFKSQIVANNLMNEYGQWKSAYDTLKVIAPDQLVVLSKASKARYVLLIPSIHLSRENIKGVDTGYSGWVKNANNVWRTNLTVLAEVVDAENGKVIWKGIGFAQYINSPRRDLDLGLIIINDKNLEIREYLAQMIEVAANGIAANITSDKNSVVQATNNKSSKRKDIFSDY